VMSLVVIGLSARLLDVSGTFPEALRVPGMRFVLARSWAAHTAGNQPVTLDVGSTPNGVAGGLPPRAR